MFGQSFSGKAGTTIFKARVEQAIYNILVKDRKMGALHDLCLELNHLTFWLKLHSCFALSLETMSLNLSKHSLGVLPSTMAAI